MNERERLIEILKDNQGDNTYYMTDEAVQSVADVLIENGVVVLPCKVGSIMYVIRPDTKQIYECIASHFNIYEPTRSNEIRYFIKDKERYSNASFTDIGKIVFFTKEEAEQALKGGAGFDNLEIIGNIHDTPELLEVKE